MIHGFAWQIDGHRNRHFFVGRVSIMLLWMRNEWRTPQQRIGVSSRGAHARFGGWLVAVGLVQQ